MICPVQSSFEKYSAHLVGQIIVISRPIPTRQEGRIASRHGRGMGCGGRSSVGAMRWSQGSASCERSTRAQTDGASTPPPKLRPAAHGGANRLVEVAAYGEVVWSWHPLLMSS